MNNFPFPLDTQLSDTTVSPHPSFLQHYTLNSSSQNALRVTAAEKSIQKLKVIQSDKENRAGQTSR